MEPRRFVGGGVYRAAVDVGSLLIGIGVGVGGAWLSAAAGLSLTRPKLALAGGGGGDVLDPGFRAHFVRVENQSGVMRVPLKETVIFGRQIHGAFFRGIPFERRAAVDCRAWLSAKDDPRPVPLWWRSMDDPRRCSQSATMRDGEQYELLLFARLNSEPSRYFIFDAQGESCAPVVPNDAAKFDDTREFRVRVDYSRGRQRFSFETAVRKQLDGTLRYETKGAGSGGL